MKKFQFSLNKVLDYKQQVLDETKTEHRSILEQIGRQEEILQEVQLQFHSANENYTHKKVTGITIANVRSYETGLTVLTDKIVREEKKLEDLRRLEAEKRDQVVEGRKDTASLEILRNKKLDLYRKEEQKREERFIDELIGQEKAIANEGRKKV